MGKNNNKEGSTVNAAETTTDTLQKGGSRTSAALSGMSLTDMVSRGATVPGVSEQAQSSAPISLFQVLEVPIEDILDSDYQTRETVSAERYARLVTSMKEEGPKEYKDAIPVRVHPTIPKKWQVARGGHTRLKVAKEIGLTAYPIIVVQYDNKRSALATGRENLAKADELSPIEEGRYYLLLKHDFGYTQEALSEELGIKLNRIKECVAAAQSAPYIIEMFARIKEFGGDTDRGLRAAKYLRRLEVFDESNEGEPNEGEPKKGLGAKLCGPLIEAFLHEQIFTDGLDIATKRIVNAPDPEEALAVIIRDLHRNEEEKERQAVASERGQIVPTEKEAIIQAPEIQRNEKLNLTIRRFRQFTRLIGAYPPSAEERTILTNMRAEIDSLLTR